jgi:predicted dehydrogenase
MATAIRFGLIGSGFMGRAHSIALHSVAATFGVDFAVECTVLADATAERARQAATSLGFARSTGDWRELMADPAIDVVDICTPNHLHAEMALAALAAGKHVYCEKPLALDLRESAEVAAAAVAAGVCHAIGFNYTCNPMVQTARDLIQAGEIGEVVGFGGRYIEDYMSDPRSPFTWRCERRLAGAGALADLGSHLINMAQVLLGPISRVNGVMRTVHRQRLEIATGKVRTVENEDLANVLIEFASGTPGTMTISRVAAGYKCGLAVQVVGTRGTVEFNQERMNELRLYRADDATGRRGFRTILAGPEHPDYGAFCPAPGHGLGINDLKVIEVRNLLRAIRAGTPAPCDFTEGLRVQRVMTAIEAAATSGSWISVDSLAASP